jgi:hypothetical protein
LDLSATREAHLPGPVAPHHRHRHCGIRQERRQRPGVNG